MKSLWMIAWEKKCKKLLIKFQTLQNPRVLDVGQCLPKTCSIKDVMIMMNRDPASMVLQQKITINGNITKANELNIIQSRIVPGEYSMWRDPKFYVFG